MANQKTVDRKIDDQASIPPPPNLKKLFISIKYSMSSCRNLMQRFAMI